mmetsp:Transcript_4141/g.8361  ORF Transcript_4141/g.8361 Transcript_4141/m.8361 type:complete len:97 (-) Transcript_4141:601-891(-)
MFKKKSKSPINHVVEIWTRRNFQTACQNEEKEQFHAAGALNMWLRAMDAGAWKKLKALLLRQLLPWAWVSMASTRSRQNTAPSRLKKNAYICPKLL